VALNLNSKKAVVEEVAEIAAKAHSAVAAEYRGITVVILLISVKLHAKQEFICE